MECKNRGEFFYLSEVTEQENFETIGRLQNKKVTIAGFRLSNFFIRVINPAICSTSTDITSTGLGQQADGTSSRRDFRPKIKLYKRLKSLIFHL